MIDIDIFSYVKEALATNQFAQGGFVIAILTALWQSLKNVPAFILARLRRILVYTVTIEQSDELYVYINRWIVANYPNKLRNVEAYCKESFMGFDEIESAADINIRHHSDFFYTLRNNRILRFTKEREKMEAADSIQNAYLGRIIISGIKSKKAINKILQDSLKFKTQKKPNTIKHYRYTPMYARWEGREEPVLKPTSKLFFPEKEHILNIIDKFQNSKDLYERRGIEWKLGMLFYGSPGTGKSSFAAALSEYTGRDLYTMRLSSLSDNAFKSGFDQIGKNAIFLIDDADIHLPQRETGDKPSNGVSLATMLSCFSGTDSRTDIIIILTTNNIDVFDEALLRKGRLDVTCEISLPNKRNIAEYLSNFYDTNISETSIKREGISIVDLQDICLNSTNFNTVLEKINC